MGGEKIILHKLFSRGHINVLERKVLPDGKVRASVAFEIILERLKATGWFPGEQQFEVGLYGGDYSQLELNSDGKSFLHLNGEYSMGKYAHKTIPYKNVEDAIVNFLEYRVGRDLDGLDILWDLKK